MPSTATDLRRAWFWMLGHTLNPVAIRAAHAGRGPFSVVRHVGRRTGRVYETPLLLARLGDDFVAELTYGPGVSWYRNVVAAGHCTIVDHGVEYRIGGIDPCPAEVGRRAFGPPAALLLRLLRRHEFRLLRVTPD